METYKLFILFIHFYMFVVSVSSIYISKNAYNGISISISESVKEQDFKFEKLKAVLVKSSEFLYQATRKRSYFGEFIIFFPSTWTSPVCGRDKPATEVSRKVDVHLTNSDQELQLTTKHSRGCGLAGDRIDMPLKWLNENTETASLAQQFVKQWSIYRYGVFEEKTIAEDSCYLSGNAWTPVGCYNIKYNYSEPTLKKSLPVCSLPSNFTNIKELRSSLMSEVNSLKVLDFCDGSYSFPHNPAMPTLHNALCKGKAVWSVVENSVDFIHGINKALKSAKPPKNPVFKCFREEPVHVTLAIQTNTVAELDIEDMSQIGSTLFEFLWNMAPRDSKITGVTFSDEEDSQERFDLPISNQNELYKTLQYRVKTFRPIKKVCLSCGLQKALNASRNAPSPTSPVLVVVIAWKSALIGENPSELVQSIQEYPPNVRLHFILVEDTQLEDISIDVIRLIRSLGGFIFTLPKERIFRASKLLAVLATVVKNPTQVEDRTVVVHERSYKDITKNFVDSFIIPSGEFRNILYIMYCSPRLDSIIYSNNTNCKSSATNSDSTFKCSDVWNFSNKRASTKWEYPFTYFGTSGPLHCSSVALLLSSSTTKHPFKLKAWLSDYLVKVPQNILIIYVEITGFPRDNFKVYAQISGPGLKLPVLLDLRDNGNGDPDTVAGDGIYSRYFTKFSEKGLYTVTVSAEQSMSYLNSLPAGELNTSENLKQVQNKTIGFFYVSDPVPKSDLLPPNQVADLKVVSINHDKKTAELQWTAPGGDYDFGKAKEYEVYYTEDWKDLEDSMLSKIQSDKLKSSELISPKSSGQSEKVTFQFPVLQGKSVYYIALRAVDNFENKAKLSNIVQVVIGLEKSPTTNNTSCNITGDGTETSTESIHKVISDNEDFSRCYGILGGAIGVLLFIIILNIIIWLVCFQKYKKRWDELKNNSQQSSAPLKSKTDIKEMIPEDTSTHTHSYSNPIMEEYAMPRDNKSLRETTSIHQPATYALVVKKDRRNEERDGYPLRRVDNINTRQDQPRHRESDLGLV